MLSQSFWKYPIVETLGYFSVVVLCLIVAMALFEVVTKYKNWQEIKNGNVAVALATGGKIMGVCNIFRYSVERHSSFSEMIAWGVFGFVLLIIAYYLYEILTPTFKIDEEIENGNIAVGLISFTISFGLSFVIGASIVL